MTNPGLNLRSRPPYVAPDDRPLVEWFNHTAKPSARIHVELLPEPYVGQFRAPVVILALNPGFSSADRRAHATPDLRRAVISCLRGQRTQHPFHYLAPTARSPGARWWRAAVRHLIDDCGLRRVTEGLLSVDYFPYHSKTFQHAYLRLPSQPFSFALIRAAIARDALIVLARGARLWYGAVPQLLRYRRVIRLSNVRRLYLSPATLGSSYGRVTRALVDGAA